MTMELNERRRRSSLRRWHALQRVLAAIMLVALLPLFALLYVLVKLTSKGPFLYSQTRPGQDGKLFRAWKVRTMRPGSDRDEKHARCVSNSSPQVTRLGKYLRQLKLDELPQLWNVLRGEMALVGPRPIAVALYRELRAEIPGFERRLEVRPGLTNLGQICIDDNAGHAKVIDDWKLRFEAEEHYLANRSTAYDLVIVAMTMIYLARKVKRLLLRTLGIREKATDASSCLESVQLDLPIDRRRRHTEPSRRLVG